jgi:hypothetical protein
MKPQISDIILLTALLTALGLSRDIPLFRHAAIAHESGPQLTQQWLGKTFR